MKKVLSVLLAAAMVMGMSVSAFAASDKVWGKGPADYDTDNDGASVGNLTFADTMIVIDNKGAREDVDLNKKVLDDSFTLQPGDTLYFHIMDTMGTDAHADDVAFMGAIDKDWRINVKTNDYIKSVEFVTGIKADNEIAIKKGETETVVANNLASTDNKYIKMVLDAEYDVKEEDEVDFYFYILDTDTEVNGKKVVSKQAEVHYLFDNHTVKYVDFKHINDVDHMAKWIVTKGEKGTAIFDFEDEVYFTVKMVSEEAVVFNFETKTFVKAIEKAFDYEADYTVYNFKGESDDFVRTGELFIPAKDDTFIYAWDEDAEELVEIEAEYVEDYKIGGMDKDGWVIETNELGYYVVSDVEVEIEAEEVVEETETGKANPETGANDFVGAAVALAVVSVAAAGALALKK